MRHLKLTIAYDGENYVGWQVQPNGMSVQERIETAWTELTGEKIRITASGRTDSGVHARGQVCSLATASDIPVDRIPLALTTQMPYDVSVLKAEIAPDGFHAIRDARGKTYRYQIQFGPILDVLNRKQRWHVPQKLDVAQMRAAAEYLKGPHEFDSFQSKGAERTTTLRTITQLEVLHFQECGYDYVDILISADGFLYNMVRSIVGTLLRVGLGREKPDWIKKVIAQKDRKAAGETAPAHGLFLEKVQYDF